MLTEICKEMYLMITIATDWILRFYFSGAVPQENVLNKEDQVKNHSILERAVSPSLLGPRYNMSLLVKPSSWPTFNLKQKKKTLRVQKATIEFQLSNQKPRLTSWYLRYQDTDMNDIWAMASIWPTATIWCKKVLGYLSLDTICCEKRTVLISYSVARGKLRASRNR